MSSDYIELARTLQERSGSKPGANNEREHCDALVHQMRKDGLLAVCVPASHGGPGLGVTDVSRITFEIARQCGSAGLIYAMHMSQAFSVVVGGDGPFFDALKQRMVKEQLLIASGTSEKGPGGDILTSLCQVEDAGEGLLKVTKQSPNISYIDHADLILVTANYQGDEPRSRQRLIAAEVVRDNFIPGHEMDLMGMRGIFNRPWEFTVHFAPEAFFPGKFDKVARETMTPIIQILWASLWSGIAYTIVDRTKTYVSKEIPADSDFGAVANHEMTRIVDLHYQMNVMIRDAVHSYENRAESGEMGFSLSAKINRIKIDCSELLIQIGTRAMSLIGLRGYSRGGPYSLAIPLADALSGPIMVSNYRLALNTAKIERFVDETL